MFLQLLNPVGMCWQVEMSVVHPANGALGQVIRKGGVTISVQASNRIGIAHFTGSTDRHLFHCREVRIFFVNRIFGWKSAPCHLLSRVTSRGSASQSPTGFRHATQECRAIASALGTAPPTVPARIMNPIGVPSPERPRAHASPPDGTALRSGNGMGAVWPAIPKGASPSLGTLGLHDRTASRFDGRWCEDLNDGTPLRSNRRSSRINVIGVLFYDSCPN